MIRIILVLLSALISGGGIAAPVEDQAAGTLTFPVGNRYTVALVGSVSPQVCNHLSGSETCVLALGKYQWFDLDAGDRGLFWSLNTETVQGEMPVEYIEQVEATGLTSADMQAIVDTLEILTEADVEAIIATLVVLTEADVRGIAETVFAENCTVAQ